MKFMAAEERDEWLMIIDEVLDRKLKSSTDNGAAIIEILESLEQAHIPWARLALKQLAENAACAASKARNKARSTTLVTFTKSQAMKSMRIGVRTSGAGSTFQQSLYEEVTWNQLHEHESMLRDQMRAIGMTVNVDRRLLALQAACPESTGPGDACHRLGVTVAEYLSGEVAA